MQSQQTKDEPRAAAPAHEAAPKRPPLQEQIDAIKKAIEPVVGVIPDPPEPAAG